MDTTIERILNLLKTKGIKDKDFVSAIGIYSSALSEWKSGKSVSYKKHIDKIADYLGVSSDYLLGRSDDPVAQKNVQNGYVIQGLSKEEFDEITSYLDYLRSKK